ncbi:hypothetical protein LOK49_LG02G01045 [Camellia lanceoleosa]|uniref:Uncharacterized protein n=1 Tax=Camellia lanceoleosa TaxID=1840588 RepID=A0ACC0IRV0_9ERIC|nr:hypothetical protein LOK49_LG02G01045 [Camellia lanceoleosa]
MSNPTMNAECATVDAFNHAGENIVFASGSPFKNIDLANATNSSIVSIYLSYSVCCPITLTFANHILVVKECKRLGWELSGAHLISNGMSQVVSECLASYITEEEIQSAILYPPMRSIRDITTKVGAAIV